MSVKVVFIILGIIFYVVRQLSKNKESRKTNTPRPRNKPVRQQSSSKPKSIDDIFNEFVKEVESANKKPAQAEKKVAKPIFKSSAKKVVKKEALDWQGVDKSHIISKKQLIDHEDYHGISHRVDKAHQIEEIGSISETEGAVYQFDSDNIDWQDAIITKEILDRKYF